MAMITPGKLQSTTCDTTNVVDQDNVGGLEVDQRGKNGCLNEMVNSCSCENKRQKVEKKGRPKRSKQDAEDKEDMAWICAECKEAECGLVGADDSADFLICDGPCHRIFHIPCAGLTKAPSTDDDWLCQDCSRKEHACAYCSEYGEDFVNVFPCQDDQCGLFFHEACLRLQHVEYTYVTGPSRLSRNNPNNGKATETCSDEEDEQDEGFRIPVFTCHAHRCWTCTQKDMIELEKDERALEHQNNKTNNKKSKSSRKKRKKNTTIFQCKPGRLYRCLYCPIAYHITCIPPSARFHELAVLCHEHAMTHKLPELDMNDSLQSKVESKIDEAILKIHGYIRPRSNGSKHANAWTRMYGHRGLSTNPFLPGLRGDRFDETERNLLSYIKETTFQQHRVEEEEEKNVPTIAVNPSSTLSMILDGNVPFCLPTDIKNEVYSKPPSYTHIQSLKFGDPNNRPKKIPGTSREEQEKCKCMGSFCEDDCFNRITMAECIGPINCNLGNKDCGNRALGKRQFVKCQPKRERGKGWGLITLESIPKNNLVQEYVGEVIDEKEKENRLRIWTKEHPYDPNFYVMALSGGYYIDARVFANQSRFINHSCAPNCKVMSVNVKGRIRNGIYNIRDIKAGEFLCYDYHFDTKQGERFACR